MQKFASSGDKIVSTPLIDMAAELTLLNDKTPDVSLFSFPL